MLTKKFMMALVGSSLLMVSASFANTGLMIYPAQGQSTQQQATDEEECRVWAGQQTGFNPAQGPRYVQGGSQGGEVLRGSAGGAALGALGGAIGGSAGKGAKIGAGVGAASGLFRKGSANRQQDQAQQAEIDRYNQGLAQFNRALATCLQGRGYTVN